MTINEDIDTFYTDVLHALMPNDEIVLFWYGKKVLVRVLEICFETEKLCLSVIISNSQHSSVPHFALPCYESGKIRYYDNVLLAIPDINHQVKSNSGEQIYSYVSACISDIKNSEDYNFIQIEASLNLCLSSIFKGKLNFELKQDSEQEYIKIPIKSLKKEYSISATLSSISKNFKKNFKRSFYRKMGGVKMSLVRDNEN